MLAGAVVFYACVITAMVITAWGTTAVLAGLGAVAFAIHTTSYLVVTTLAAWVVYRKLGVGILRTTWFNVDRAWAAALVVTGIVVLLS